MEQLTYGEEVYRFELGPSRDPQLAAFYQSSWTRETSR